MPSLVDDLGTLRLDIDIGKQKNAGSNSVLLGDIEKPSDSNQRYVEVVRKSAKSLKLTSSEAGSVWLLFGTDSGYEGETALYYTYFRATFLELSAI